MKSKKHHPPQKRKGETYADILAKKRIGQETLRMAMEDEAVRLASDIICQRQLWR